MASGFISPATFQVRVYDLLSHGATAAALRLSRLDDDRPNSWRWR
jgi:hypothetical protein